MKHSMSAVLALALGFGLATAAQAHGIYGQQGMQRTNMRTAQMQPTQGRRMAVRRVVHRANARVKEAQEQLKSEGLYKGRIDGVLGRQTRRAIAKFQKKNGLRETATLDRNTLNRLMGGQAGKQAVGVGSSMPQTPNNNMGNNDLGNSNAAATNGNPPPAQMTPPTNPNPNEAGTNNANTTNPQK